MTRLTDLGSPAQIASERPFDFEDLAEALPQIVWSCDASGTHDYFNSRWFEFTGLFAEQAVDWTHLVHAEDLPKVMATWQRSLVTGCSYDINYRFRHHSGDYLWLRVMARPITDDAGRVIRWFGTSTDTNDTILREFEDERETHRLRALADTDPLTGLLNRRAFFDRARQAADQTDDQFSILVIDIDHFKDINDSHGHTAGDVVIQALSDRLKHTLPASAQIGRIGGEEFIVALSPSTRDQAEHLGGAIRMAAAAAPVGYTTDTGVDTIAVTVSVGGCTSDAHGDLDITAYRADQALYRAKDSGRDAYRAWQRGMPPVTPGRSTSSNPTSRTIRCRARAR